MAAATPILSTTLLLLAILVLGSCTDRGPVMIFCSPDSPRMRQVLAGLEARLGALPLRAVCVPEFGDEGQEKLRQLRQARPRLLVVLGTAALRWAAPVEKRIPIVFAAVGNPFFTGATYNRAHPEIHQENVTGIATPPPLAAALQHGTSLLGAGRWGLLVDPTDGAAVELTQRFLQEAPRYGVEPLIEASTGDASDRLALERLVARGARVIYLLPASSATRYLPLVLEWGQKLKVRVVSSYPEGSHQGAVLWVALDYHRLGEEAGEVAARVLSGESPARIPIIMTETPLKVDVDEYLLRQWNGYPPATNKGGKGKTFYPKNSP